MFNVSQEEWNRIFPQSTRKQHDIINDAVRYSVGSLDRSKLSPAPTAGKIDEECCGCEGCGFDCGCMCS